MKNKKIMITVLFLFALGGRINSYTTDYFDYIIGVGDVIKFDFIKPRYLSQIYTVDNKGLIKISPTVKIKVQNKTLKQLKSDMTEYYSKTLHNPELDILLLKSYKTEQTSQNNEFNDKLESIKESFLNRDYSAALQNAKQLIDIIETVNSRDNQVQNTTKFDLEFSELKYSLTKKNKLKIYEISGKLKNNINKKINWVKAKITFINNSGKPESTKDHYIVKDIPIYQMQIIPFEIKGMSPYTTEKINVEIFDYVVMTETEENNQEPNAKISNQQKRRKNERSH